MTVDAVPITFESVGTAIVDKAAEKINDALATGKYVGHLAIHGREEEDISSSSVEGVVLLIYRSGPDTSSRDLASTPEVVADKPIYRPFFMLKGQESGAKKGLVTRSWGLMQDAWRDAQPGQRKADTSPAWIRNLFISADTASYNGLRYVLDKGLYQEIFAAGPKTQAVLEAVIKEYELSETDIPTTTK